MVTRKSSISVDLEMMYPFSSSGCDKSKILIGSSRELRLDKRVSAAVGLGPGGAVGVVPLAVPPPLLLLLLVALPVVGVVVMFKV